MISMSFATPGMTNDFHSSNMQTQQPYFSNAGQIDFRPGVKISHETPTPTAAVISNEDVASGEYTKVSFALKNKEHIVAELTPIAPIKAHIPNPANDVNKLTVAENSKRLARMICDMSAGNEQEYATNAHNGLHESVNPRGPYAKYNNLRSHVKTADPYNHDKFDLLVQEFIDNGNPDLHAWINMNPKRQMMTYGEALAVHKTIMDSIKEKAKKVKEMARDQWGGDRDVPTAAPASDSRLEKRVNALELEQQQLVEAGHQNRLAIKEKVGHIETKVGHIEKGLVMHHAKLDSNAMELKNLNSKTIVNSRTPTKSPLSTNKQLREGFSKTVTTPVAMDFEAMNRAIAKAV